MSIQTDLISPVDLTIVDEVTDSIVQQAINNVAPLDNIGFIIFQPDEPDVENNPRFIRYKWFDTSVIPPVEKIYNTETEEWVINTVPAGSVTTSKIVDGAVTLSKIGGFIAADAVKFIRVKADYSGVEVITLNASFFANGSFDLNKLTNAGGVVNYFLKWNNAGTALEYAAFTGDYIAVNSVQLTKLVVGSAGQLGFIVRANPISGVIELVSNNETTADLLAIRSVRINRLEAIGAALGDKLWFDGVNWVRVTPFYSAPTSGGVTPPAATVGANCYVAHGFAVVPKKFGAKLVCISADAGYAVGDVVDVVNLITSRNTVPVDNLPAATLWANVTNVGVIFMNGAAGADYKLLDYAAFTLATFTPAKWNVFIWAEK